MEASEASIVTLDTSATMKPWYARQWFVLVAGGLIVLFASLYLLAASRIAAIICLIIGVIVMLGLALRDERSRRTWHHVESLVEARVGEVPIAELMSLAIGATLPGLQSFRLANGHVVTINGLTADDFIYNPATTVFRIKYRLRGDGTYDKVEFFIEDSTTEVVHEDG